jgi:predicted glycogen debranching enzyme
MKLHARETRDGEDTLWPRIRTDGQLERAQREWLHTNGAGAYSMSTLALMHTRRQHGVFVAALDPPLGRHVILSHTETSVEYEGRLYRLSTHQFPEIAPTPGYRLLASFSQDPLPRWIYRLGRYDFERIVCLVRGENTVVIAYTWRGPARARLTMKPLMPLRAADGLMREHGAMMQRVTLRPGEVEIQPVPLLPPIIFGHSGMFMGSPDWWRRFEYAEDRDAGGEYQEDMWTPGMFELLLEPGRTTYLLVSVGRPAQRPPGDLVKEAADFLRGHDPGPERLLSVRRLSVAAEQYCADACTRPLALTGFPHFGAHLRDVLMSLPGLHLARGRIETAKRAVRSVLRHQRAGLLALGIAEHGRQRGRPSPDATLWLFEISRQLVERVGFEDLFVKSELYPALRRAFVRLCGRRRRWAWLTPEGLLATGERDQALTWMDARSAEQAVTPRRGAAVELQALWTRGALHLAELAAALGDEQLAAAARAAREAARESFRLRFWCSETYYPYDFISEDRVPDRSIRPNALLALAIDPSLFEDWQAAAIIERVRRDLLTPAGVRSLAPADPVYHGYGGGTLDDREASLHQGSCWPFLLGFYVRAALGLAPDDMDLKTELRQRIERAAEGGQVLGHVAQLSDGDSPYRWRGSPAQAWSVAELLRALVVDLKL